MSRLILSRILLNSVFLKHLTLVTNFCTKPIIHRMRVVELLVDLFRALADFFLNRWQLACTEYCLLSEYCYFERYLLL